MRIFQSKWEVAYVTQNQSDYFIIKDKLIRNGIRHKTKIDSFSSE